MDFTNDTLLAALQRVTTVPPIEVVVNTGLVVDVVDVLDDGAVDVLGDGGTDVVVDRGVDVGTDVVVVLDEGTTVDSVVVDVVAAIGGGAVVAGVAPGTTVVDEDDGVDVALTHSTNVDGDVPSPGRLVVDVVPARGGEVTATDRAMTEEGGAGGAGGRTAAAGPSTARRAVRTAVPTASTAPAVTTAQSTVERARRTIVTFPHGPQIERRMTADGGNS